MNGAPGTIRTSDPQIRRLPQVYENEQFFFKPCSISPLPYQGVTDGLQTDLAVEKQNPGALAGATGAACEVGNFKTQEYRERAVSATRLCAAIAECHPEDAVLILSAALQDMAAGAPLPVWQSALEDARWWASYATQFELKAWCLASFEAMHPKARTGFLAYAARGVVQ